MAQGSYLDLGASSSTSSGASQSGATSQKGGGNYLSSATGPGSLVLPAAPGAAGGVSISTSVVIAIVAGAAIVLWLIFGKR